MDIEQFRQHLTDWGVNVQVLFAIGITSFTLLVISVRVILKWYLGIQHLESELAAARAQLAEIQEQLRGTSPAMQSDEAQPPEQTQPQPEPEQKAVAGAEPDKNRPFRLTH